MTEQKPSSRPTESPGTTFVQKLSKLLPSADIERYLRVTARGLFADERLVEPLISAYQQWVESVAVDAKAAKSREKCQKRLFGREDPTTYYLLDGKHCLPGFLLQLDPEEAANSKLPRSQAGLIETLDYLHPRDPILTSQPQIAADFRTHQGFVLRISLKEQTIEVPEAALKLFAAVLRQNRALIKRYPKAERTLRDALSPLVAYLNTAERVTRKHRLLVPLCYKGEKDVYFLRARTLIFVVSAENVLLRVYDLGGLSLSTFVREELSAHLSKHKNASIKAFKIADGRSRYLGKLETQDRDLLVHPRAFSDFLKQAPRSEQIRKALPVRFTVWDCAEHFAALASKARRTDEKTVPEQLRSQKARLPSYRRCGSWFFQLSEGEVILSCLEGFTGTPAQAAHNRSMSSEKPRQKRKRRDFRPPARGKQSS